MLIEFQATHVKLDMLKTHSFIESFKINKNLRNQRNPPAVRTGRSAGEFFLITCPDFFGIKREAEFQVQSKINET
jgi:hypothetical protein